MAKKKITAAEREAVRPVKTCIECEKATQFSFRGHDGLPICCRCPEMPQFLHFCSHEACVAFVPRVTAIPSEFAFYEPENPYIKKTEKGVPVFGEKGELLRCVPVEDIGPKGIHWDGSPME